MTIDSLYLAAGESADSRWLTRSSLDPATPAGRARLDRLGKSGLYCFWLEGLSISLEGAMNSLWRNRDKIGNNLSRLASVTIKDTKAEIDRLRRDNCQGPGGNTAENEWLSLGDKILRATKPELFNRAAQAMRWAIQAAEIVGGRPLLCGACRTADPKLALLTVGAIGALVTPLPADDAALVGAARAALVAP